jgi:hypothetical protein
MLPEDRAAFLSFVQGRDPVVVTTRDSDSADVQPISDRDIAGGKILCLWNRSVLPSLEREQVPSRGYFTVSGLKIPVLEYISSFTATWEGTPALGQGRLFGNFEAYLEKPPEFQKWYEGLVRWIRRNYSRNPESTGGYVAPAAFEFYKRGGYLLPNFVPPRTEEWLAEIGKQHPRSRNRSARLSKKNQD